MHDRHSSRGVTLVEALVVLALLAIAMAITIPNFRMYLVRSRVIGPMRDIERISSLVRLRAINSQRPGIIVFVKESATHADFSGTAAAQFLGKNSVVAFIDENSNDQYDATEELVGGYVFPKTLFYSKPGGGEAVPTARVAYNATGTLASASQTHVYLGDANANYVRLVFFGSGQIRRQKNVPGEVDAWLGVAREPEWRWNY